MKFIITVLFVLVFSFASFGQQTKTKKNFVRVDTLKPSSSQSPEGTTITVAFRVVNPSDGRAISGGIVKAVGTSGEIFYAKANAFGYFRFVNLPAQDYAIYISHKRRPSGVQLIPVFE